MNLVDRVKNILLSPATEWGVIKDEEWSVSDLFTKYAMLLAAIPAVGGLIGYILFGFGWAFGAGLTFAIATYVLTLAGVFILAFIIDALAPTFGASKNLAASMKVVVFSYTASWVAGILTIIPFLGGVLVGIAGLYSLYLMWLGLKTIKEVPEEKMVGYFIVVIVAAVVVYIVIGAVVRAVAFGGLMRSATFY